jgi:hypothetical protein
LVFEEFLAARIGYYMIGESHFVIKWQLALATALDFRSCVTSGRHTDFDHIRGTGYTDGEIEGRFKPFFEQEWNLHQPVCMRLGFKGPLPDRSDSRVEQLLQPNELCLILENFPRNQPPMNRSVVPKYPGPPSFFQFSLNISIFIQ